MEVVRVGDRLSAGLDDEVAGLDPGRCGKAPVLDATDEDPITLGQTDRTAHPARDVRRGDGHAEARASGGFATTQGIDPGTELGVGREGQVEPFADAVGVETDELAVRVEERSARRSGSKRRC